ncbi:MAG: glycosyltransferase family 2 protein [Terriglobales bacterium]
MDTQTPVLSIIIVTWNGKRYALECLESLSGLGSPGKFEIIVVDNASSDGSPEAIAEQFPNVLLIRNQANLGFAKANNIGISQSSGRYVCLLNSDVVVPNGCMEKMVDYLENNRTIGLLGPKMLSPDGSIGQSVMRLPTVWNTVCSALGLHTLFPRSKLFGGFLMEGYPYDRIDDVEVLTGWFWLVPRAALEQVGGLDEQFFMYGEDIDWSHRFAKAGWRVVFYPDAEALHYGAASSAEAPTRFYIEMRRANLQYFRKHHGRLGSVGYIFATSIHELVRIGGYSVVYCCAKARRSMAAFKMSRSASCLKWLIRMGPVPQ